MFAIAADCQSAFARGGGHRGGGGGGSVHHGGYGGYGWGYGRGGGYGYGRGYYNSQAQMQNQAWNEAHHNPLSLGPYSSVPRQITASNQSYVVREYNWPTSSQLASTQSPSALSNSRPGQLAGKNDLTR
jgi:hypothetical protein